MKDNDNKLNESSKNKKVSDKFSGRNEYSGNALNDELEALARLFENELKNAESLSEEEFEEVYADEYGIIEDDDLCECCGERRKQTVKGKNVSPYCKECHESMKHYPISFINILFAVVLVFIAGLSVFNFSNDFYGYDLMYKAEKAQKEDKLATAQLYYADVIGEFSEKSIKPKYAYLSLAEIIFNTIDVQDMDSFSVALEDVEYCVSVGLTAFEKNLFIYNDAMELQNECIIMNKTLQEISNMLIQKETYYSEKYGEDDEASDEADESVAGETVTDGAAEDESTQIAAEEASEKTEEELAEEERIQNEMYEDLISSLDAIADKSISIVSDDGETTMYPTNKAIVRYYQHMIAYGSQKSEESYEFIKLAEAENPDYLWLYGYDIARIEIQLGNLEKGREYAEKFVSYNKEDYRGYIIYTNAERLLGNFKNAAEWANKGNLVRAQSGYVKSSELLRYEAMALCAGGDSQAAEKVIDESISLKSYVGSYSVAIVVENELGNKDIVEEYKKLFEEEGLEIPERIQSYLDGKMTAAQLFSEGTGDVI